MYRSARWFAGFALAASVFALVRPATGQPEQILPPSDRAPRLVLAHAGPHAPVTAIAFAPDGSELYVAGFDKLVRRYALVKGEYVAAGSFRVPVGPWNAGLINALAVSPDGKWVAAAGRAPLRGEVWAGAEDGIEEDVRFDPPEVRGDAGIVYLFDPKNPEGGKAIRGQLSEVRALAFANPAPAGGHVLVTTGIEWNAKGEYFGAAHVFDVKTGKEIASRADLPSSVVPPTVAAWATGDEKLRVAVAWDAADRKAGKLLVWDEPGTPNAKTARLNDGAYNSTLAVRHDKTGAVAELVTGSFLLARGAGALTVRGPDGAVKDLVAVTGKAGHAHLPVGVAALTTKGGATAVLSRIVPPGGAEVGHALRVIALGGGLSVELDGINANRKPVLAASPDGRFVAVGGFADNRVEVYDAVALAAGKPAVPQKLAGVAGGFAKVAFLAGEKLWLGKPADTVEKGGVILDLDPKARAAVPRGANEQLKIDAPGGPVPKIVPGVLKKQPWSVVVTVGGAEKTITLPEGEIATAAAFLPAKPAWDAKLGPVLAIADLHYESQSPQITLYDLAPDKPKALYKLGGPTLPVRSLAFSGTRALLAGAGDDGSAAVWSLKNVAQPVPMIEGLMVTTRGNEVVVSSVLETSPAKGRLAVNDVIESVADGDGKARPMKVASDFVLTVRALGKGADAQIKPKGKAAVVVKVGTATGFRLPLFDLWVDPLPKDGKHAWVGWTSSGPYDTSGLDGETRIGWLTATGDPARPVTVVGAEQHRKLFYKPGFIRSLVLTADYGAALKAPPPTRPELKVAFAGTTELRDGRDVAREKLNAAVTLDDPDRVHDISRAELRWQVAGPDGASEWVAEPFSGRAALKLSEREWKRGKYTVSTVLYRTGKPAVGEEPLERAAVAVEYVPPAPELAVKIDNKPASHNGLVTAAKPEEVEVAVAADAKFDPAGAKVVVSWTGGKPIELSRNKDGGFDPLKIKLGAEDTTVLVTATNRGAGATAADESRSFEVVVRKPAKKVPPPAVKLLVLTPFDLRTATDQPHVVSTQKVLVTATARDTNPITQIEWKYGDREWVAGKLDPNTNSETREIDLKELQTDDAKGVSVQVRVTSNAKLSATDSAVVRYDGLPEISVELPPTLVTGPELNLSGGLKVTSKRRFAVRVLVTSSRTGRTREFDPTPNKELTAWDAGITLFPGENQLGYVVRYDDNRKELRRAGLVEVRYVRPPVVLGGTPLEIGTGASGSMTLAVTSATDAPPQVLVNGNPVGARASKGPLRLFGVPLWVLTATGVPANRGADRLKPVSVLVRNAERDGSPVDVKVNGLVARDVPPPTIALKYGAAAIAPDRPLPPVGDPNFTFDVRVNSAAPLTRVEVWQGAGPDAKLELVDGVSAAGAGGEVNARPTVRLRPGAGNYVKVLAANGGEPFTFGFYATYTPPPVRVQIDAVREPNGKAIAVTPENAAALKVAQGIVEVEGRVMWDYDDEPAATDPSLSVVFVANGVAHLPVAVAKAQSADGRMRRFVGRVYLNSPDANPNGPGTTRVRAELRSGLRAVPQVGTERAAITVESQAPIARQRLHVLLLGVEVPESTRGELARKVVTSIGGKIPADDPNFTYGQFERDKFEFARLYPPRLGYTKAGDLNLLLDAVQADIERRTKRPGEEWVNDVILLYYQGADWKDDSGRWFLHTATTMSGAAGKNPADYAIRPDDLRPIPGMLVAVVNVTGAEMKGDPLSIDLPYLRYAWTDRTATVNLLSAIERAVAQQRTVEQMRKSVDADLTELKNSVGKFAHLPDVVLARVIGLKKP